MCHTVSACVVLSTLVSFFKAGATSSSCPLASSWVTTSALGCASVTGSDGLIASTGVAGVESLDSFGRLASRFFSAVRRNTLIVVRSDLFGLQSSALKGECSQTGHDDGRFD